MVPRADHTLQAELWEALCNCREERLHDLGRLRKIAEALRDRLNQTPEVWADTMTGLDRLGQVYESIDPHLLPAAGLTDFLTQVEPLLQGAPSHLAVLLRQVQTLDLFLRRSAPDIVTIYD